MREHNHRVEIRLNDREYRKLKELTARSKLTRTAVIRKMIDGQLIVEHPPIDYFKAWKSLEECRQKLTKEDMFNPSCGFCMACREALSECQETWNVVRNAYFDPSFFQAVNLYDKEDENAFSGNDDGQCACCGRQCDYSVSAELPVNQRS